MSCHRCAGVVHPSLLLLFVAVACRSPIGLANDYEKPPQTNDGWETAHLPQVGMDAGPLLDLLDLISSTEDHMIHSLLLVKDRKLVFEEYWPGSDLDPRTLGPVNRDFDRNTLHFVASVSKSITSGLVGIAIDRGHVGSVEDSVFSFFPEYTALMREDNAGITLEHLLSFSSGYDWNEQVYGFDDPRDSHYQMFTTPDPIGFLLGRPVVSDPGSEFHYNSGDTNILGEIVRKTSTSQTLVEFADRNLFQPLGIERYDWVRFPLADNVTFASGGVSLRPRDMAKLGVLYLNGGVWTGERIVSTEWVGASTVLTTPLVGDFRTLYGYGYNWWLGRSQYGDRRVAYFRAAGWGGQYVYVFPELELIIVFTAGGFYETRPLNVNDIIEYYIFQAIVE
jgi:CubicO group peptidase (beta-lactamase class C family)